MLQATLAAPTVKGNVPNMGLWACLSKQIALPCLALAREDTRKLFLEKRPVRKWQSLHPEPVTLSAFSVGPVASQLPTATRSLETRNPPSLNRQALYGSFRILGAPSFGVLLVRILLFRVLYQGLLFSETPIYPPSCFVPKRLHLLGPRDIVIVEDASGQEV